MKCLRPLLRIALSMMLLTLVLLPAQSAPARATTPADNPGETIAERDFFGWMTLHVPLMTTAPPPPEPPPPPPPPPAVFGWLTLPTQVTPGSIVPVRINLQNAGLGAASGVRVTFPFDGTNFRLVYTQLDVNAGDWVSATNFPNDFTVQFGRLNAGATRSGTVFLQIADTLKPGATIRFRARYTNGACGNAECPTNDQRIPVVEDGDVENPFDIPIGSGPPGSTFLLSAIGFIPGERVVTWLNLPNGGTQSLTLAGNTDGRGNISFQFSTPGFAPGFYSIVAHGQVSAHEMIGRFEITTANQTRLSRGAPDAATVAVPAQATGTGQIGGVVREAGATGSASRLAGVLVIATATESGASFSTLTDALGGYRLTNLPAGSYTVRFEPRWSPVAATRAFAALEVAAIAVNDGEVTPVPAELLRGAAVSGAVSGAIGGLGEITVLLISEDETVAAAATTGADGRFSIAGVPVGTYTVRYVPTQVVRRATSVYGAASGVLEVPDTDPINDVAVLLPRAPLPAQISGRVTAEGAAGVANILVLFTVLDEATGDYRFVTSTLTNADGAYSSGVLPAGTYRVRALPDVSPNPAGTTFADAAYREDAGASAEGTPISIAPGAGRDDIDLILDERE